ncbi:MAG: hypothetical protein SNJ78_09075 [Spirochaetales bacterium]
MKRKELILHLIGELANFSLSEGPNRMVISLHQEEDGMHLTLLDSIKRTEEELKAMADSLHSQARPELSEYYGTMAGHDLFGTSRLELIGWQVKHANISRTDSGTKIDLWLGGEQFDPTPFNIPKK